MKTKTELIKFNQGLDLESGARLNTFDLMVETYGELNKDKDNAILVCHAFSGNHHAAGKSSDNEALAVIVSPFTNVPFESDAKASSVFVTLCFK